MYIGEWTGSVAGPVLSAEASGGGARWAGGRTFLRRIRRVKRPTLGRWLGRRP